jgi:hypothetical protein
VAEQIRDPFRILHVGLTSRDFLHVLQLKRINDAAKSSDQNERLSIEDTAFMQITRTVARKKGKWDRFGPEVK